MVAVDAARGLEPAMPSPADKQRLRASQSLLSLGLISVFAVIQQLEVMMGLVSADEAQWMTAFNVGTSLAFHLLIRSNLNLRLAPSDPSMTFPQCLCAVTAIVWCYAITGPARGALVAVLVLVILFGGMLHLRPGQTRAITLYALALLAAVMAWRSAGVSPRYDPGLEFIHFAVAVIVLAGASQVAVRLGRMRANLAMQKADLAQALELSRHLATRDSLTGLLNRRAMTEVLALMGPRAQLAENRIALAMLDIDLFKRINDSHGHQIGDAVLQRFADLARDGLRVGDVLARWGGEEFLLLMPQTSPADAALVLARLRESMASAAFDTLAPGLAVSFSAGLTEMATSESHEAAIARADHALYSAKRKGRDRVETA